MELTDLVRILRRRWIPIVAAGVVGVGGAAGVSALQAPSYESATQVFVSTQTGETSSDLAQSNAYTLSRVLTYAELASSERVLDGVIGELGLDVDARELARRISAAPIPDTTIIQIVATDDDPDRAAAIANATATSLAGVVADVEGTSTQASPVRLTTVEEARPPESASSPRWVLNLVLGGLLALALATAVAVLRDVLDTRIRSPHDVELATHHPVIGTIAYDARAADRPLVVHDAPHDFRAEAYRSLRTNLLFVEVEGGQRTFVVTSSVAGEGKTTATANLAIALAQSGQTVLLVDADLRKPRVADVLGIEGRVGLTTVLIGDAEVDDAVQDWGGTGLFVLPAGRVPPNPSELLGSRAMESLLRRLEGEYDWILVDAPPLLPVTDAAVLATRTSGAIVVVAAGSTTRGQLDGALARLGTVDVRVAGVLLTRLPTTDGHAYAYGYGYGPGAPLDDEHAAMHVAATRDARAARAARRQEQGDDDAGALQARLDGDADGDPGGDAAERANAPDAEATAPRAPRTPRPRRSKRERAGGTGR
ncbi:polysaccharide biosynthesis tyrosine autokinase [Agrococcus sp. SGAir0287]|uniref:polysaccharide biosynthesis tyrosine autokinase n=1 Tax=Agrococcus sp. SGAir0287 TaxID=2070347 RepID=UPI0010CD1E98|nr:polysaccharide biosynthesis tyrosine autokinase [Agrococcus sp. SGAir0287]QCR19870.1 chromosome partitioning protein [Agrococcus sp. SGAir0287]